MASKIFVNVAVKDLNKSIAFWKACGYNINPQFTDESGACLVFSENIYAMLLTHNKFKEFSPNPICDTSRNTEVLLALALDSRQQVEDIIKLALDAGGRRYSEPKDHGFMYQDGFQDPDGHVWEVFYMDPNAVPQ